MNLWDRFGPPHRAATWGARQPPPGVRVSRDHPWSVGLLAAWVANPGAGVWLPDLSGNEWHAHYDPFSTFIGAATAVPPAWFGRGDRQMITTSAALGVGLTPLDVTQGLYRDAREVTEVVNAFWRLGDFSMLWIGELTDITQNQTLFGKDNGSSDNKWMVHLLNTAAATYKLCWTNNDFGAGHFEEEQSSAFSVAVDTRYLFGFTKIGNSMTFFKDGASIGTASGGAILSTQVDTVGPLGLSWSSGAGGAHGGQLFGRTEALYVWGQDANGLGFNRGPGAIPDQQMFDVMAQPYDMFETTRRVVFFPSTVTPTPPPCVCMDLENNLGEILTICADGASGGLFGDGGCSAVAFFPNLYAESDVRSERVPVVNNVISLLVNNQGADLTLQNNDGATLSLISSGLVLSKANTSVFGHYLGWRLQGIDAPFRLETVEMEYAMTRDWDTSP